MYQETHLRSVVKSISWRLTGTIATAGIVLIFTGQLAVAVSVGAIELLFKLALGFFHERLWNRIRFGITETRPVVVWLTGLAGSGKTELAHAVWEKMKKAGYKVELLNGGSVRHLFPELGFSSAEVDLHIKRIGHLASRLESNGVSTVASFVSPLRSSRQFVKNVCKTVIEVHVDSTVEECEQRLANDFYTKARNGILVNVPGISTPFQSPSHPDLTVNLSRDEVSEAASAVIRIIEKTELSKKRAKRHFYRTVLQTKES